MRIISLFSGAGGLDLGLIQAGNDVVWANDIDKDAVATYRENIGNHIVCDDIKNIDILYTDYEYKYIDIDEEHDNSEEKIGNANFKGSIQFEQVFLPVINFKGYFTHSHGDNYNLNMFYQCTRNEYFSLADDAALDYIDECIYSALIENFPEQRCCEIKDISFTFTDTPHHNTHNDE